MQNQTKSQTEINKQPLNILITGRSSYLGKCTDRYLQEYNAARGREKYRITRLSLREKNWKNCDFSAYDTVLHMAGIAHADIGKATEEEKARYYRVNCDLAVETALKAKNEGVKQFVYMSSVIVYGDSAGVGGQKHITADTPAAPSNFYGDSKLKAEQKLSALATDDFRIAIVRTPMVYGRDGKGNFPVLQKLAEKLPIFPTVKNKRSMIYTENLAEFLRLLTDSGEGGIFYPQNAEYISTWDMVRMIAAANGKKILPCPILNPFVYMASRVPGRLGKLVNKAFGSMTVDQGLSHEKIEGYCKYSPEESIRRIYQKG